MKYDCKRVKGALKAAANNMSKDETRMHLNGVRIEFREHVMAFIATDGHTLTIVELETPFPNHEDTKLTGSVLLTATDVKAVIKMLGSKGEVDIEQTSGTLTFTYDGSVRCCVLSEHTFPPYQAVMPKPSMHEVSVRENASVAPIPAVGLQPAYLARLGKSCKDFAGNNLYRGVKMQAGGELDPVLFQYDEPGLGQLLMVIMPMRI